MKKILLLLSIFTVALGVSLAQPISGIPDKNFYPEDSGKPFNLEYKLYQTYTRFFESWNGGVFARIQNWRDFGGSQGSGLDNQVDKDMNFLNLNYCNRNMNMPSGSDYLSFKVGGAISSFKAEDGKYYMFMNVGGPDSLLVTEADSGSGDDSVNPYWFRKSKMPFKRINAAGKGALGGHIRNGRYVIAWISSDPVFVGPHENCTMIRYDKQNQSNIDSKYLSTSVSIQKTALKPNGDVIGLCAYRDAGRRLKVMHWDSSLVAHDSFTVANSSGFTKANMVLVDHLQQSLKAQRQNHLSMILS